MKQEKAWILLGSNMGNRDAMLQQACDAIEAAGNRILQRSSVYETAAWGITDQPAFLNMVIEISTSLNPEQLMQTLLEIEMELGRVRTEKYGPRTIDLDILFYGNMVYHSPMVTIPHPAIQDRRFVLEPLCELAPLKVHPVYKKSMQHLLQLCKDPLEVKRIS